MPWMPCASQSPVIRPGKNHRPETHKTWRAFVNPEHEQHTTQLSQSREMRKGSNEHSKKKAGRKHASESRGLGLATGLETTMNGKSPLLWTGPQTVSYLQQVSPVGSSPPAKSLLKLTFIEHSCFKMLY